jgi:hypothetical protein
LGGLPYVLATLWLTTCGSPLYLSPTGGLRLPVGKHASILTDYHTLVNKKMKKISPDLLATESTELIFQPL